MIKYSDKAHSHLRRLEENGGQWNLVQILITENKADIIAKSAMKNRPTFQNLKLKEELVKPSIE